MSINEMRFFDEFLTDGSNKKFYFQFQHVKNHLSATRKTHNVVQFFRTTVVVRQGYILSLVLSNKCLENIMMKTFKDYNIFIPISKLHLSKLRFADNIWPYGRKRSRTHRQQEQMPCQDLTEWKLA